MRLRDTLNKPTVGMAVLGASLVTATALAGPLGTAIIACATSCVTIGALLRRIQLEEDLLHPDEDGADPDDGPDETPWVLTERAGATPAGRFADPLLGRDERLVATLTRAAATAAPSLSVARSEVQMLAGRMDPARDEAARRLAEAALRSLEAVRHELEVVQALGECVRRPARSLDLARLATQVAESCRAALAERGTKLSVTAPYPLPVLGHPLALAQAIRALVEEGVQACSAVTRPGRLELRVSRSGDRARVELADTGRIVRLVGGRTRPPGGRGASPFAPGGPLSVARELARGHGGDIRLEGQDPHLLGGRRVLDLPLWEGGIEAANGEEEVAEEVPSVRVG